MLGKEVYIGIIFYINMSIIVRSNSSYNGNNNVGDFPPGPVKNVNITPTYNSIKITVTKPDDTIINGITLSVFSYLRCVLKKNDMPLNVKDGINITVHSDQFNDGSYIITFNNLDHSSKYYIRFFTFSTNNQCNDSEEMIYETYTPEKPISSILNDNDWDTIIKVAESGQAQKYWKVGDEVDIQLSGTYNIKCTMQIWGFNHFNKVNNGNNKDNILFGCKDIYIMEQKKFLLKILML